MFKIFFIVIAVIILLGLLFLYKMLRGPDLSKYEYLKKPQIVSKQDDIVIEVAFELPSKELSKAFKVLYKTYFKIKGVKKSGGFPISRARYKNAIDMQMNPQKRKEVFANMIWKGSAAISIPSHIQQLPEGINIDGLSARLNTWEYGEVAEILHIGPYEKEPPTVQKLMDYIDAQGYEICGLHEEEYLKGPGQPFVKPENYFTIIRYPVKKKK